METKLTRVTARIMGEDYTIRGQVPEEHIRRIAKYVDERMIQISETYPKLGTSRVAVLAAINMADELFKIREQYEQLTRLLEEEWSQRHGAASPPEAGARTQVPRPGRLPPAVLPETAATSDGREGQPQLFTGDALRPRRGEGWEPPEDEEQ